MKYKNLSKKMLGIEEEAMIEASINKYSFFNEDSRFVLLVDEITRESAVQFVDDLFSAAALDPSPIIILINSPGGDAYSTMMIIDAIRGIEVETIGLCMGLAGSGAFYAFQACTHRVIMTNSLLFWHEMIHFEENLMIKTAAEMDKFQRDYKKLNEHLISFFKKRVGFTKLEWDTIFLNKNDILFNATESLKYRLADKKIDKIARLNFYFKQKDPKNGKTGSGAKD